MSSSVDRIPGPAVFQSGFSSLAAWALSPVFILQPRLDQPPGEVTRSRYPSLSTAYSGACRLAAVSVSPRAHGGPLALSRVPNAVLRQSGLEFHGDCGYS